MKNTCLIQNWLYKLEESEISPFSHNDPNAQDVTSDTTIKVENEPSAQQTIAVAKAHKVGCFASTLALFSHSLSRRRCDTPWLMNKRPRAYSKKEPKVSLK